MPFHRSTCPFCSFGCGLLLQEEEGRLVASYPSAGTPGRSALCVRGWHCTSSWSHPDRLTAPMVRGPAGLVRATWRDAVEEIASRLGRAASPPLFALGPSLANEDASAVRRLANLLGGRVCPTEITGAPVARLALRRVLGAAYGLGDPDSIRTADLVWVLGVDGGDCPMIAARVAEARRRGAAVVRFDVHASADDGTRAVPIPPGRFGDLALCLQRAAFEAGLVPEALRGARGFTELSAYWRNRAGSAGPIEDETARDLVRKFQSAKRPVAILGSRWLSAGGAESHTVAFLQALALLGAGDRVVPAVGEANSWGVLDVIGPDPAPPAEVACREDDLDTLFVVADDIVRRSPRPSALAEALSRIRTVVLIDRFATDSLPFAHVVLPSCTFAEADGSVTNLFGEVQPWRKVVAPAGDCQPERLWMSRIGQLFGSGGIVEADAPADRQAPRPATWPAFSAPDADAPLPAIEADGRFPFRLVLGSEAANWSTGVVSQRDDVLRREVVESILAASPAALKEAGVKPGWPVRLVVPGAEATVTVRSDPRLPSDVLLLVPLAGSPQAALRGFYRGSSGGSIGLQPVPARLERA